MAQHQHALIRYAVLDRYLARRRSTREELMERCGQALERVTGEPRQLSDKTFYNDIRALREGLVLGRAADIRCVEGLYSYAEPGFSLFGTGQEELLRMEAQLEAMAVRAQQALRLLHQAGVDAAVLADVRALLDAGEPTPPPEGTVAQPSSRNPLKPVPPAAGGSGVVQGFWSKVKTTESDLKRDGPAPSGQGATEPVLQPVHTVVRPPLLRADGPKAGAGWLDRLMLVLHELMP